MRLMKILLIPAALLFLSALLFPNPSLAQDADGDGMPDSYENTYGCLQPNTVDATVDYDADGMTSLAEYSFAVQLDPCDPDSDKDGVNDGVEVSGGSNPLDGNIKPAFMKNDDEFQISNSGYAVHSVLISNGLSSLSIIYNNNDFYLPDHSLLFSNISPSGDVINTSTLSNQGWGTDFVWTGTEFGVVWNSWAGEDHYFTRLSPGGTQIGQEIRLFSEGYPVHITWTGSEFGLGWVAYPTYSVNLERLSPEGAIIGNSIIASQDAHVPTLVWSGSEFGTAWMDNRDGGWQIYFSRISDGGTEIGSETRLTTISNGIENYRPQMVWTGSEFGVSWERFDYYSYESNVYFTRVDSDGTIVGNEILLTGGMPDSGYPSVGWSGSEFGFSWTYPRSNSGEIYFLRLSEEGNKIGDEIRISDNPLSSYGPYLTWTGQEFAVSWTQSMPDNFREIFLTTLFNDEDGDGLGPSQETSLGTDANDWDSDDDLLADGDEVKLYLTDPINPDSDTDGLSDSFEIFTSLSDPLVVDTDRDGLTDGEEVLIFGSDPTDWDTDGDLINDGWEVYNGLNPWLIDTDGDGLADGVEINQTFTNPLDSDSDGDGSPDGTEAGGRYLDADSDFMPTHWESEFPCLDPSHGDSIEDPDADTLSNLEEYNLGTDPCNPDTDGDGIDDNLESATNPTNPDTDGDRLTDGAETTTDPADADSDDDGYSDGAEVEAGSDPTDPGSVPMQSNYLINYQGRLTNEVGTPVEGSVTADFAIFDVLSGGTELWSETQTIEVDNGIYHVLLGSLNDLDPSIFQSEELYLAVSVNGEQLLPRQRITSVPSALHAERAFGGRLEMDTRTLALSSPSNSITITVSFKQQFNSPPQVMVSGLSDTLQGKSFVPAEVNNITTSGFDVTFRSLTGASSRGSASFTYMAFGQ